jgi:hypothetical protein
VARKDLSRTVIEGGRSYYNSYERRASHGAARARTRDWLDSVLADPEIAELTEPRPRKYAGKSFYDKLAPAERWLASQVGRPWSKVFSELCAKFDTRTIAGAHVVHDHMLAWVSPYGITSDSFWHHRYFFVDAHGILRRGRWYRRSFATLRTEFTKWVAGRYASRTFGTWWWFRSERRDACTKGYACQRHHEDNYHLAFYGLQPMTKTEAKRIARSPSELTRNVVF